MPPSILSAEEHTILTLGGWPTKAPLGLTAAIDRQVSETLEPEAARTLLQTGSFKTDLYDTVVRAHLQLLAGVPVDPVTAISGDSDISVYLAHRAYVCSPSPAALGALRFPSRANALGRHWMVRVFTTLPTQWSLLERSLAPELLVACAAWMVATNRADKPFRSAYASYLGQCATKLRALAFPTATQTNEAAEPLVAALHYGWTLGAVETSVLKAVVIDVFNVTYQSVPILAVFIEVLLLMGDTVVARAAMVTYLEYIEKQAAQGRATDPVELVALLSQVPLDAAWASALGAALETLRTRAGLEPAPVFEPATADALFAADALNPSLTRWLALGYAALANHYEVAAQAASTHASLEQDVAKAVECRYQAAAFGQARSYRWALAYALSRASVYAPAISLMKREVRNDPADFQSCHLLVLCYSAEEATAAAALLLASNAVLLAESYVEESQVLQETKGAILELKKTQVALVEHLEGLEAAMERLPEVFALYGQLYEGNNDPVMLTLTWLWASALYIKAGAHEEALAAIDAAESAHGEATKKVKGSGTVAVIGDGADNMYVEGAETVIGDGAAINAARGYAAALQGRYEAATAAFEQGMATGEKFQCTVGLALLFLKDDLAYELPELLSFFISETDKASALVRLKLALETFSLDHRYSNRSEVWWYLSRVYETFDDQPMLKEALWRCVAADQARPVRDFTVCQ